MRNNMVARLIPLYIVWGKVRKGAKRGRALGFPTANIPLHKKIADGIYTANVTIDKQTYNAVTFIGAAKTFQATDVKLESYIIDLNQNLYGKWVTVRLFKKLRSNKAFSSAAALVKQMEKDVSAATEFFRKYN